MLPTLPIANAAPRAETAQPRGAAGDDDADAFAHVLQHAQHPPKAAHDAQAKTTSDAGDAKTKPAQASEPRHAAHDAARDRAHDTAHDAVRDATASGAPARDAAHERVGDDADDTAVPTHALPGDAPTPLPAPGADVTVVPHAAVDPRTAARAPAPDDDTATAAVEDRVSTGRATARGPTRDQRIGSTPGHPAAASPPDATGREEANAATVPQHAAAEQHVSTTGPSGIAATRTASFAGVLSGELTNLPSALPTTAAPPLHDTAAATVTHDSNLPQANLYTGIDEPQFGTALGHQVALWVRDGVQEARLQLHPAELGPVTVQIALDGQAAHVEFGAAVAATRDSIEQSLPALAAALRESGFTLAGGGVSSQAGQRGDGDAPRGRSRASTGDPSRIDGSRKPGAVAVAPRRWARSLLDVYA
ncbi:MAG TPA: flagellar hook-length control protein FliK [Burkholderiaceae bacterium]|nr:flagellar hook-length control protein FliK [Burkholderiaceae bacterium]